MANEVLWELRDLELIIQEILRENSFRPMSDDEILRKMLEREEKGLIEKGRWKTDTILRHLRKMRETDHTGTRLMGDASGTYLGFPKGQKKLSDVMNIKQRGKENEEI